MLTLQIIGAALLLAAYFGLQAQIWSEISAQFITLNMVGAGMLATTAWIEGQFGFAVLNTVWCLVAIRSAVALQRI